MNIIELAKEAGFSITTDWMGRPSFVSIGTHGDIGLKGTQELERFAALVRAEREWIDLTDDEMWAVFISRDWVGEPLHLMSAVIAAFKEKNK